MTATAATAIRSTLAVTGPRRSRPVISTATGAAEINRQRPVAASAPGQSEMPVLGEPSYRSRSRLTSEELQRVLRERGLQILAVTECVDCPELLIVYLHGNAGQWLHGHAHRVVAQVPGVVTVSRTPCPTILRVRTG